jgi:hypothetical protein
VTRKGVPSPGRDEALGVVAAARRIVGGGEWR